MLEQIQMGFCCLRVLPWPPNRYNGVSDNAFISGFRKVPIPSIHIPLTGLPMQVDLKIPSSSVHGHCSENIPYKVDFPID